MGWGDYHTGRMIDEKYEFYYATGDQCHSRLFARQITTLVRDVVNGFEPRNP